MWRRDYGDKICDHEITRGIISKLMLRAGFFSFLLLTGSVAYAQHKGNTYPVEKKQEQKEKVKEAEKEQPCFLDMQGLIYVGKSRGKAEVKVFEDSVLFLRTESDKHFGKTHFLLPYDKVFIVEISKEGFVSKKIKVDTHYPPLKKKKTQEFRFEVDILEDIPGLNVSVLKKPVAEISYNGTFDAFIYDVEYTSKVNKDLKKLYQDYYLLQKASGATEDNTITPVEKK
jgi:hypothetical protein